jgi:predicted phage-related endonuclease
MEKRGELENAEQTDNQRWGLALEEPIRSAFEEDTDIPVLRLPPITMYRSKQLPIALISPDGLTVSRPPEKGLLMGHMVVDGLFEAKTSNLYVSAEWEEGVPAYYAAQASWGLAVSGLPVEHFGVLVLGGMHPFSTFTVEADPSLHDMLFERAQEFWHLVETGVMPDVDGSSASTEALKRRFKKAEPGKKIEGGFDLMNLIGQWQAAKDFAKDAETQQDEIENRIRLILGDAEIGMVNGMDAITWKEQGRTSLPVKETLAAFPGAAALVNESRFRVLRSANPKKGRSR